MNPLPTIETYMATEVLSLSPETDIHKAIKMLVDKRISGAPVLDGNGDLIGILSKKDGLRVAFSASYHREPGGRVRDYMSTEVETVEAGTTIIDMAERFLKGSYRRFPVMRDDRLVGVISRHDIMKAIADMW